MRVPLVSVVMPVFNGLPHLVDAVASVIEQTLEDWELICIDDGSQDGSGQVLDWFAGRDARIRVVHQPNAGIVDALNRGCGMAAAPLIARLDSDDLAVPSRLQQQVSYLREHPQCRVLGSAILEIDQQASPLGVARLPTAHAEIVHNLLHRRSGHFHPTVMMRTAAWEAAGGYRREFQWVEDHDLWLRMAQRGQLANLNQVLVCYRQHAGSVCWKRADEQRRLMDKLICEAYRIRNQTVPVALTQAGARVRSPAGPGKWARAAARGGYPRVVFKHLRRLIADEQQTLSYKSRMVAESLARLCVGWPKRWWSPAPRVPQFEHWHRQLPAQTQESMRAA